MAAVHFTRVEDDGFRAAQPDSLMESVSRSDLKRTFTISVVGHLVLIFLLSLGNFGLCIKYRTPNLRTAFERRDEAAREAQARIQAEEREARKQALAAKAKPSGREGEAGGAPEADAAAGRGETATPKVIQEATEVSDLRPEASSLDSIDDLLEE